MTSLPKRTVAVAGICVLAFSGMLLAGCSSGTDREILDKLDRMEAEIAQLKDAQSADGGQSGDAAADAGQPSSDGTAAQGAPSPADAAGMEAAIADLEARAADAIATADAVAVPDDPAQRPQAYFEAKAPLETLEHEADTLDDQLEALYRQGAVDADALWALDQRIDAVEDKLDHSADNLELRMGVDD